MQTPMTLPTADVTYEGLAAIRAEVNRMAAEKGWNIVYKDMSSDEMKAKIDHINKKIYDDTKDEFERRFSLGMYEVLNTAPIYEGKNFDPTAVYWVRIEADGPVQKVTLPKAEFPEVCELKTLCAWLDEESRHRK